MVHIRTTMLVESTQDVTPFGRRIIPTPHAVLVVRDDDKNNEFLDTICEFLDIGVEHAPSGTDDVPRYVAARAPSDGGDRRPGRWIQDGFHVMKVTWRVTTRTHLPIMLLLGNDPALLGAVDAVQAVWGLTKVAAGDRNAADRRRWWISCAGPRGIAGRDRLIRVQSAVA